ncbi:MAG: NAD-dependent epimerase/dehydratase family protein [Hydrogenophaga sp.]|nr:NAD-dependent epimerase/dehydratase family protein [Hydrogenophaga sp.]
MTTSSSTGFHLIFGTGPVGCWTAHHLRANGVAVKAVNRSGQRPALMPADVAIIQADLADAQQAIQVAHGARVVYQALGPAYTHWAELFPRLQANTLEAAARASARYVALENLYMLDPSQPMTEHSEEAPRSVKGRVRQQMHHDLMACHQQGDVPVSVLRSSDFYGPGVKVSAMGERVFDNLLKGKSAEVMVRADCLHSFAYIGDVGKAMATLGLADDGLSTWGKVWLAPHAAPLTQQAFVAQACALLGIQLKLSLVKPWLLQLVGLFNADAKAIVEMLYQFEQPFVVDSSVSDRALGLHPTDTAHGLKATLDWYRQPLDCLHPQTPAMLSDPLLKI